MPSKLPSGVSTHLSVLYDSAQRFSSSTAFYIPNKDDAGKVVYWSGISYAHFLREVEYYAQLWRTRLAVRQIPERSVVGLWLPGFTYLDVLHIYGITRAGYIPQLFSIRLPNPEVVFSLLKKTNASALIANDVFSSIISSCPIPSFTTGSLLDQTSDQMLQPLPELVTPDASDIVFIYHTSGSTSGSPKLVPVTASWWHSSIQKAAIVAAPKSSRQDVTVWMGSLCHIAQSFMLTGFLQYGSCMVQPTQLPFSSSELQDMIHRCGLNRLNQFATFLGGFFRDARKDAKLLADLQSLDSILYTGLPLSQEDEEYAYANGMKLSNIFGSTEMGGMMLSLDGKGSDAPLLRPIAGTNYSFQQADSEDSERKFLELVVLAESIDCPHVSVRHADGHFHTGDLFQEVKPGCYKFCGRNDDWIKSENSLRCDTRAIEENVLQSCGDLVASCIVAGTGRPSPALFVELAATADGSNVRGEILKRIQPFHTRLYLHERITSPELVIVVPAKSLPRTATKGNIRRQAVETAFKEELDTIYAKLKASS